MRSLKKRFGFVLALLALTVVTGDALAIIGRPLTPMSAAGVARRTVRRTALVAPAPVVVEAPPAPTVVIVQ